MPGYLVPPSFLVEGEKGDLFNSADAYSLVDEDSDLLMNNGAWLCDAQDAPGAT